MLRLLNRFRNDLAVAALPQELESSAARTVTFLESEAARVSINSVETRAGLLQAEISVRNLGGALAQVVGYLAQFLSDGMSAFFFFRCYFSVPTDIFDSLEVMPDLLIQLPHVPSTAQKNPG